VNLEKLKQKELAELLGLEDRSVRNLAKEGLPSHGAGKELFYVWSEVRPWYIERQLKLLLLGRASGADKGNELNTLAELEKRKLQAETEFAEMRTAKMAESLVDAEDVRRTWSDFLSRIRTNLFGFADRVAPKLEGATTVAERVVILREEMAKTARDIVAVEGGSDAAA